jgi:hypothetical protein
VEVDTFEIEGQLPVEDPLTLRYRFHTATFATANGASLTLRPGMIERSDLPDEFRSSARMYPVRFRFGLHTSTMLTISFPEGWEPGRDTVSDYLSSPFGWMRRSLQVSGNTIRCRCDRLLKGGDIPPDQYLRFRAFLDAVRARDLQEVALHRE